MVVEELATCEGRMYWQIPLAQDLVEGLGRSNPEGSPGTGLLGDTILELVSGPA